MFYLAVWRYALGIGLSLLPLPNSTVPMPYRYRRQTGPPFSGYAMIPEKNDHRPELAKVW